MSEKPSPEDISKLHAEMNQYTNQRLVITTTAITIFGVVMGWVVSGLSAQTQNGVKIQTQPVSLLLPTALLTVLVIMLWYCQAVVKQMHILSVYLELTGSSNWEKQYQRFTKSRKFATQDDLPLIIFATMGILSILIPSAISLLFPPNLNFQMGMVVFAFFISSVVSVVIFFQFWNERHYHCFRYNVERHWQTILFPESNQGLQRTDSKL